MSLYIRNNTAPLGLYLDDTFLRFVIEFILGITIALDTYKRKMNQYSSPSIIAFAAIELTCFIILMETSLLYNLPEYVRYSITTFSRICFFILVTNIFLFMEKNWKIYKKIVPLLSAMSLASYSVYLFHRPLLTIVVKGATWNWFIHQMLPKSINFITLAVFSFPLIFFISYWIQIAHDSMQKKFFFTYLNSSIIEGKAVKND